MKYLFFFLVFLFSFNLSFAQSSSNYDEIILDKEEDYKKAEPAVLQAADFLLTTPINAEKLGRAKALQFIIKWMQGTPDYMFEIDASTKKISDDLDLFGLYMSAITKFCIENPSDARNKETVKLHSWKMLLDYCKEEKNNVKLSKKLKKLMTAYEKGALEKELN